MLDIAQGLPKFQGGLMLRLQEIASSRDDDKPYIPKQAPIRLDLDSTFFTTHFNKSEIDLITSGLLSLSRSRLIDSRVFVTARLEKTKIASNSGYSWHDLGWIKTKPLPDTKWIRAINFRIYMLEGAVGLLTARVLPSEEFNKQLNIVLTSQQYRAKANCEPNPSFPYLPTWNRIQIRSAEATRAEIVEDTLVEMKYQFLMLLEKYLKPFKFSNSHLSSFFDVFCPFVPLASLKAEEVNFLASLGMDPKSRFSYKDIAGDLSYHDRVAPYTVSPIAHCPKFLLHQPETPEDKKGTGKHSFLIQSLYNFNQIVFMREQLKNHAHLLFKFRTDMFQIQTGKYFRKNKKLLKSKELIDHQMYLFENIYDTVNTNSMRLNIGLPELFMNTAAVKVNFRESISRNIKNRFDKLKNDYTNLATSYREYLNTRVIVSNSRIQTLLLILTVVAAMSSMLALMPETSRESMVHGILSWFQTLGKYQGSITKHH